MIDISVMMRSSLALAAPLLLLLVAQPALGSAPNGTMGDNPLVSERARAYEVIAGVYDAGEDWASIHAAEIIVQLGGGDSIRDAMLRRMGRFEKAGIRVGAWRVMAMIVGESERNEWSARLERVFLDSAAIDRLQALESLAKVKHPLSRAAFATAAGLAGELAGTDWVVLPLWAMAASGDAQALESLVGLLGSADIAIRRRSAYALRRLRPESAELRAAMLHAVENEPHDTIAYPYLLCTALDLQLDARKAAMWREALRAIAATAAPKVTFEILQAVAAHTRPSDGVSLIPYLDDADGDVRIGAAFAVLTMIAPIREGRHSESPLRALPASAR
jgi:hypothetical protein